MREETPSCPAICHLTGGPQDGAEYAFEVLPILLFDGLDGGYYQRTGDLAEDGAHVFEYHALRAVTPAGSR